MDGDNYKNLYKWKGEAQENTREVVTTRVKVGVNVVYSFEGGPRL